MKTSYEFQKAHVVVLEPGRANEYCSFANAPQPLEKVQEKLNCTLLKTPLHLLFTEVKIVGGWPYFATPSRTIELTYLTQYDDNCSERVGRKRMKVIIHEEIRGVIKFDSNAISHEVVRSLEDTLYKIYFPMTRAPKTGASHAL